MDVTGCIDHQGVPPFLVAVMSSGLSIFSEYRFTYCIMILYALSSCVVRFRGQDYKEKKKNSTQNKSQTQRARAHKDTSFLNTDCELSTETCSTNVYSFDPRPTIRSVVSKRCSLTVEALPLTRFIVQHGNRFVSAIITDK